MMTDDDNLSPDMPAADAVYVYVQTNEDTAAGAWIGGGIGLVVGLFAPPLLAATAIGAGIGALLGHLSKKHEEKELGVELDEYFPPNSSAVVVVVDDKYLDRVEGALTDADKRVNKAISQDDYDQLQKAVSKSDDEISDSGPQFAAGLAGGPLLGRRPATRRGDARRRTGSCGRLGQPAEWVGADRPGR